MADVQEYSNTDGMRDYRTTQLDMRYLDLLLDVEQRARRAQRWAQRMDAVRAFWRGLVGRLHYGR